MFENLIKITRRKGNVDENNNQIELPAFSDEFINIKAVKFENLKRFLESLKCFNERLSGFIADLYRNENNVNLCKKYEEMVSELSQKEEQIKYLSSYTESMQLKIEAFQKQLNEKEATIKRLEDEKISIVNKLINLRENQSKPIKLLAIPWRNEIQLREQQQNENVTLSLSTICNASTSQIDNDSDWMDLE